MNSRERFLDIAHCGKPDRWFLWPDDIEPATLTDRWRVEGMPLLEGTSLTTYLGFDNIESVRINAGPMPPFEQVTLEDNEQYTVFVDTRGIKIKSSKTGLGREWLDFPVKTREDFEKMKMRYNAESPSRYPESWDSLVHGWKKRDCPTMLVLHGVFYRLLTWMGLQGLSTCFYRDPDLMHEMMDFWVNYLIELLHRLVDAGVVDFVMIGDSTIAQKTGPITSPSIIREFVLPRYGRLTRFLREHGIDIILLTSEGNMNLLIPMLLEAGINGVCPLEVSAYNNLVALREKYPRLIMVGVIDKRILSEDKNAIKREVMSKVPRLLEAGGYFPRVDGPILPDVSFQNFLYYLKVLRKACEINI